MSVDVEATAVAINGAVKVVRDGAVGWVILTRPGQINAINDDIRQGVPAALALLEGDCAVRAIAIRGEGERGFCAGADIKEKRGVETSLDVRKRIELSSWIDSLDRISKPVIVAIHGYCMGGGLEFALAADIRVASPDAILSLPETGLGLIPGGGGTQRLSRVVSPGHALDMLLTGDSLLDEVSALAHKIAAKPPMASAFVKRAARASLEMELGAGLSLERDLFSLLATTKDAKEAALAFRERRQPVFTGE